MANTFTISDLDGAPLAVWGPDARELPQAIEGRLDSLAPVRYQFTGSAARGNFSDVRAVMIAASDLEGPAQAFDGTRLAQTFGPGRMVRISHWDNGDLLASAGLLVLVRTAVGAGGPGVQQVECVFYPMPPGSLLYGPGGTVLDTAPDEDSGS
jgi:hypothetical protein